MVHAPARAEGAQPLRLQLFWCSPCGMSSSAASSDGQRMANFLMILGKHYYALLFFDMKIVAVTRGSNTITIFPRLNQ